MAFSNIPYLFISQSTITRCRDYLTISKENIRPSILHLLLEFYFVWRGQSPSLPVMLTGGARHCISRSSSLNMAYCRPIEGAQGSWPAFRSSNGLPQKSSPSSFNQKLSETLSFLAAELAFAHSLSQLWPRRSVDTRIPFRSHLLIPWTSYGLGVQLTPKHLSICICLFLGPAMASAFS